MSISMGVRSENAPAENETKQVATRHRVTTQDDFKLRPVLSFAATETRARDWCNIITW